MVKPKKVWSDEKQRKLDEGEPEFKIKPFKPRFVPPEVIDIKFTIVKMPYLGEVFKCEECGCILMTENDMKRHLEYERDRLKKYNAVMRYKLLYKENV